MILKALYYGLLGVFSLYVLAGLYRGHRKASQARKSSGKKVA